mgnify:CR=1 FL=1
MSYFHLNLILKGKLTVCCLLMLSVIPLNAQREAKQIGDFKESISLNEHLRGTKRTLQYRPDGDEFVCVNGKNRYTRALYGSHSPFRVETSDRPVFAFYNNGRGGNISFVTDLNGRLTAPCLVIPFIRLEIVLFISQTRLGEKENCVFLYWH